MGRMRFMYCLLLVSILVSPTISKTYLIETLDKAKSKAVDYENTVIVNQGSNESGESGESGDKDGNINEPNTDTEPSPDQYENLQEIDNGPDYNENEVIVNQ